MSATVIGASTRIHGSIEVTGAPGGDLVVEGFVDGEIRAGGKLTLGRNAQVTGAITAHDVRIEGRLDRNVQATGVIHLAASAEVRGDLEAARVVIDDGAIFEGQVRLRRGDTPRAAAAVAPATRAPQATPAPASYLPTPAPPTQATAPREVPMLSTPGRRRAQRRSS